MYFDEDPWEGDASIGPVDSTYGVAIYACAADSPGDLLPPWWHNVWDETRQNSIPRYYLDNSFGKHGFFAKPYGRDSVHCFVSCRYPKGTVVADSGIILGTTPSAGVWERRASGVGVTLRAVSFIQTLTGTAVGDSGMILRTQDFGHTWMRQNSRVTANLRGVSFCGPRTGLVAYVVAVGDSGTLLWTTTCGARWDTLIRTTNDLYAVSFARLPCESTAFAGIAVGDSGAVLRTVLEYGINWAARTPVTSYCLRGVSFADSMVAYAVGDSGIMIRTTDAGESWDTLQRVVTARLNAIYFADTLVGYAVGDSGIILKTSSSGDEWRRLSRPVAGDLNAVYFYHADSGIVVGDAGVILTTEDGGRRWTIESTGTTGDLHAANLGVVRLEKDGGGCDFTCDILTRADSVIDFSEFDYDGDDIVDMAVMLIQGISGQSQSWISVAMAYPFPTHDTSSSGEPIVIKFGHGLSCLTVSEEAGLGVPVHEYAHQLGLGDYYLFREPVKGNGLGRFDPMTAGGFQGRLSPFNPWTRSKRLGWLTPVRLDITSLSQPVRDISLSPAEVYELDSNTGAAQPPDSGQKFLVSNHQRKSFWEEKWPAKGLRSR